MNGDDSCHGRPQNPLFFLPAAVASQVGPSSTPQARSPSRVGRTNQVRKIENLGSAKIRLWNLVDVAIMDDGWE